MAGAPPLSETVWAKVQSVAPKNNINALSKLIRLQFFFMFFKLCVQINNCVKASKPYVADAKAGRTPG